AGPDPAAKTLRTGVACAVQTPRADVRPILQGTFVVTAVPRQPRVKRQFVAIVRPPAVHTQRKRLAMARPIITDVATATPLLVPHPIRWGEGGRRSGEGIIKRTEQIAGSVVHVKNDFEIQVVK